MRHSSIGHYKNLIGLFGVFCIVLGCASTPKGHKTFLAEGSRIALPKTGTRVVVRGNHSGAVNQAIPWLNDHQLLVVNRWVEKEPATQEIAPEDKTKVQAQVQAVAHKVGATLMVFVHVDETLVNRRDPISGGNLPMKMIGVEIQGINAETGQAAFGAMAWNPEPVVESENVVQELTVLALEKSWKEPEVSLSHQQKGTRAIQTEQKAPLITPVPLELSDATPVAQPVAMESTKASREHVTVFTESVSAEMSTAPVVTQPVTAEGSGTSEDSSLGLQIASGALSIVYMPFKVVYAGLGGLFGGFAYLLTGGNEQVAQSVGMPVYEGHTGSPPNIYKATNLFALKESPHINPSNPKTTLQPTAMPRLALRCRPDRH